MTHPKWMDSRQAPLPPCSVETIPEPVKLAAEEDGRSSAVWPLMLSCYQLDETVGHRRVGRMDLHLVSVPDLTGNLKCMPLQFGEPQTVLQPDTSSGVLDGKWCRLPSTTTTTRKTWYFATAHSSGEIQVHAFGVESEGETADLPRLESDQSFAVRWVGQSDPPVAAGGGEPVLPLCLSLGWDSAALLSRSPATDAPSRIVSTYSNGTVSIHDVAFLADRVELIERDSWTAHNMFTNPAEVWSACFVNTSAHKNLVMSAGDEGGLKLWDIRSTTRPMQVVRPFDAGVTCVSPHPVREHLVAVGSYDETICLFDVRCIGGSGQKSLCRTQPLGGGIWRIKWHPVRDNRVLVAAMHGGCRVLNLHGLGSVLEEGDVKAKCTKKFTEHESMAYGADWLVCPHPTQQNSYFEAAASCSFYDRAMFLWDSVY